MQALASKYVASASPIPATNNLAGALAIIAVSTKIKLLII